MCHTTTTPLIPKLGHDRIFLIRSHSSYEWIGPCTNGIVWHIPCALATDGTRIHALHPHGVLLRRACTAQTASRGAGLGTIRTAPHLPHGNPIPPAHRIRGTTFSWP